MLDFVTIYREMDHKACFENKKEVMQSQPIQIRRGIFQGDSLSPLIICIAHTALINELNKADCGYQVHGTERKISHLMYMEDLKMLVEKRMI